MLRRRCLLSLSAAVGIGLEPRNAAAADGVRLVCGFGAGNPTELCAQLIHDGWSANLDQPVTFDYTIGEAGLLAAREVVESMPDGKTLLLGEILNLVLHDARGADLLPRLMPIAKITRGFSTAIIASEYSELSDWQSLAGVARKRRLRAATTGALSPVGIGLALVQRRMGLSFDLQRVASTTEAADLVRTRRADLAAVETRLALLHNSRSSPKFKVITTFGARRSRELPQVPTFAEIAGDRTLAYTISYGVFAPVKTDPAIAARLTAGLISLKDDKNIQAEARLLAIPLHIDGPSAVLQTIDRDRSVAENLTV